jgi:tripartite-type tricarboxylate transporter receptor subunit TctC
MISWTGLFAPAGTPPDIVTRLNQELNQVLQASDVQAQLATQGALPGSGSAQDFAEFVKSEQARYERIVKTANIKE